MPVPDSYKPSDTNPPSRTLRASDYTKGDKWNLTISDVEMQSFQDKADPSKPPRNKLILSFEGRDKGLVLNTTNKSFLESELGDRPNAWVGSEITLVVTSAPFQGKMVPSFSIRSATLATLPPKPFPSAPFSDRQSREPGEDDL